MTILLAVLLILTSFYVLALVTEHYFVPAIDIIANKLKISSDAAGATLLAMGSSAPEFFTSLVAVLGITGGDHADIGAGAIVGSAIFNVLVIIGVAAMFKTVTIQWQPVSRDLAFYVITILLLLYVFRDGAVTIQEAIMFVITYGIYVFSVTKWRNWFSYDDVPAPEEVESIPVNGIQGSIHKGLQLVLPDVHKNPHRYIVTFLMCIAFIAGLSWLLVEQVVFIADTLHINATFLALTVLAAGTSVPDLIGSIVVAKQGRGDMAVSNAIGSNIFDVLFGLGFPWLVVLAWRGGTIAVGNENLQSSVILLFATVIAIITMLIARRWKIGRYSGLLLVGLYIAYCIFISVSSL